MVTNVTNISRPRDGDTPAADPVTTRIYWWRRASVVVAATIVALVGWGLARNAALGWGKVGEFLFNGAILRGLLVTIEIALISTIAGIVGGLILAVFTQSNNPVIRGFAMLYIWVFRGVPLLVQIIFWFNFAIIMPRITIALPGVGTLASWDTNTLIGGFSAALLGLSLNESAYMAEIIRGSLAGVPRGQMEAALSIGMTKSKALRKIILPQTIGILIPPTGNQFIGLIKNSSLVSVVGGGELLTHAQYIYGSNFAVIPLLIVASIWYLVLTSVATVGQHFVERRLERSPGVLDVRRLAAQIRRNLIPGRVT